MADIIIPLNADALLDFSCEEPYAPLTTIHTFLCSPTSTAEDAVAKLLQNLNDGSLLQEPWDSPENTQYHICGIFSATWYMASQIPARHPWHRRLASLIKVLGKQPPLPREVCVFYGEEDFKWDFLPGFGAWHPEDFDYKLRLGDPIDPHDAWSPQECSVSTHSWLYLCISVGSAPPPPLLPLPPPLGARIPFPPQAVDAYK